MRTILLALAAAVAGAAAPAYALDMPDGCRTALSAVPALTGEAGAATAVEAAIADQIGKLAKPSWAPGYCRALADNFASKAASRDEGVTFTTRALLSTGVEFEAFRITSFRNSGVAPKRYFGFVDGQGRAGAYESKMKDVARRVAPILNAYASKKGLGVTVAPKEIVVTHIAEGAALLLSTRFANVDRVHPVRSVGLDDYHKGFWQYQDLVGTIDEAFHTHLDGLVRHLEWDVGSVGMTFEESVLGTAVMYLWEKAIAEEKRRAEGRPSLATLPLDEQYVNASLVYNSGILFVEERVKQIMAFETGPYLVETSEKSTGKRPKLPVMLPDAADVLLARGEPLPEQTTSWNAVYHILQRYGAWVALTGYTTVFTPDGGIAPMP